MESRTQKAVGDPNEIHVAMKIRTIKGVHKIDGVPVTKLEKVVKKLKKSITFTVGKSKIHLDYNGICAYLEMTAPYDASWQKQRITELFNWTAMYGKPGEWKNIMKDLNHSGIHVHYPDDFEDFRPFFPSK